MERIKPDKKRVENFRVVSPRAVITVDLLVEWMLRRGFISDSEVENTRRFLLGLIADMNSVALHEFRRKVRSEWSGDLDELVLIAEQVKERYGD